MKYIGHSIIALAALSIIGGLAFFHSSQIFAAENSIPSDFRFEKTLFLGQYVDPDVKYLQMILNKDNRTKVSDIGAGSPMFPTSFFGPKTRDAVMRFQELYRNEILTPGNIAFPTGIVGELTRKKLNQILSGSSSSATTGGLQSPLSFLPSTNPLDPSSIQSLDPLNKNSDGSSSGGAGIGGGIGGGTGSSGGGTSAGGGSTGSGGGNVDFFGGSITNVTYCTCSTSVMLDINDKVTNNTLTVVYIPGVSRLYANYNIFTAGPNVIGGYWQGSAQCLIYSGNSCQSQGSPRGTIDSIRGIGSSSI